MILNELPDGKTIDKARLQEMKAHSMLIVILKDGVKYKYLGADYYNQFNWEQKINVYLKKLKELGWTGSNTMNEQPA